MYYLFVVLLIDGIFFFVIYPRKLLHEHWYDSDLNTQSCKPVVLYASCFIQMEGGLVWGVVLHTLSNWGAYWGFCSPHLYRRRCWRCWNTFASSKLSIGTTPLDPDVHFFFLRNLFEAFLIQSFEPLLSKLFRPCVIPSPFWFSSCNDFFADVTSNGGICFFFVVFVVLGNFKKISSPGCKSAWRIWGQMKKKLVKKLICQMLAYSCGSNWKMSDIEGAIGTCFEPY